MILDSQDKNGLTAPCPSCGRCPTCGGQPPAYGYPYLGPPWYTPIWVGDDPRYHGGTFTVDAGMLVSSC